MADINEINLVRSGFPAITGAYERLDYMVTLSRNRREDVERRIYQSAATVFEWLADRIGAINTEIGRMEDAFDAFIKDTTKSITLDLASYPDRLGDVRYGETFFNAFPELREQRGKLSETVNLTSGLSLQNSLDLAADTIDADRVENIHAYQEAFMKLVMEADTLISDRESALRNLGEKMIRLSRDFGYNPNYVAPSFEDVIEPSFSFSTEDLNEEILSLQKEFVGKMAEDKLTRDETRFVQGAQRTAILDGCPIDKRIQFAAGIIDIDNDETKKVIDTNYNSGERITRSGVFTNDIERNDLGFRLNGAARVLNEAERRGLTPPADIEDDVVPTGATRGITLNVDTQSYRRVGDLFTSSASPIIPAGTVITPGSTVRDINGVLYLEVTYNGRTVFIRAGTDYRNIPEEDAAGGGGLFEDENADFVERQYNNGSRSLSATISLINRHLEAINGRLENNIRRRTINPDDPSIETNIANQRAEILKFQALLRRLTG